MRTKHMPVLPTDSEKRENESTHVASRSQCKTEDSRKHLEIESSLPRVGMNRGFLAQNTEASRTWWKPVRCPTKPQSLMRSIVRWKTLTRMAWAECCSKEVLSLTPRRSLTQFGSDEVKG